ncbi:ectoine hydroxylase [Oceanisphaera avium]|uniref:Ectoine hydroxylase n=1 Tax=Oceanisphaera avium TaxID=1903694 RepID=A0A1Y0CYF1_9GAMM|nr:ectoine hydroxylase [Oceanisphaera avium]ART80352.1 ectoine hydroxylase [Oceanisphaera avium]
MTMCTDDCYPSRLSHTLAPFKRLDPIVYGSQSTGPLTSTELAQYERDGFLVIKDFLDEQQVQDFQQDLQHYQQHPQQLPNELVIKEAQQANIRSIFDIHKHNPRFDELTREPRLLAMVEQLLGSEVYIHQSRINVKPAFYGKGFDWHSDFETWHTEDGMPRMRALSCSIALTPNTQVNGSLMLIPGSHHYFVPCVGPTPTNNYRSSLQKQQVGVPSEQALNNLANQGGISMPTGPSGSLILFECNTLHASNANLSPWPRSNLFFVYNSVHNRLTTPFCGQAPRPEHLANRQHSGALVSSDIAAYA